MLIENLEADESGNPRIVIVVPVFNTQRVLAETLRSISSQTETRWQCVIVDDGSSDDSLRIAREFAALDSRFVALQQANSGPAAARNHGYRASDKRSQYVTFMDADDIWLPNALEKLCAALDGDSQAVAATALAEYLDEKGQLVLPGVRPREMSERFGWRDGQWRSLAPHEPTTFDSLLQSSNIFPPGVVLMRRSAYERTQGWDANLKGAEDWDLLLCVLRQGHAVFVNEVVLHYRRHESNLSSNPITVKSMAKTVTKTFRSPENSPEQRAIIRLAWKQMQRAGASYQWREARAAAAQRKPKCAALHFLRASALFVRQWRLP